MTDSWLLTGCLPFLVSLTRLRLGLTPPAGLTVEQGTYVLMSWPSHGTSCHSQTCQKHINNFNNQEKDYLVTTLNDRANFKHWFQAFQVDALICLDSWSGIALFYIPVLSKANKAGTCSMFAICLDPSPVEKLPAPWCILFMSRGAGFNYTRTSLARSSALRHRKILKRKQAFGQPTVEPVRKSLLETGIDLTLIRSLLDLDFIDLGGS